MTQIRDTTDDDFDAVFDLLTTRSRAAFGISSEQPAFLRQRWDSALTDNWVAVADGGIVGYAGLDENGEFVHAARDPDVGDALIAHVEDRARVRDFPYLAVVAAREDAPLYGAVQRNGYGLDRAILRMWRMLDGDLRDPVWPEGVTLRLYTDAEAERVQTLLDEEYARWDPSYVARSHATWLTFMTEHEDFDPALWFLAERDDELVACALHWKESQGRGWVKDLVVRESERGRGLAKALLHHGFRAYAERGADRVGLKVDSTNPTGAPQLYERLGFVTDQRLEIWRKAL
ncbi:MAG TPA: GNAT family N-acetyltransferase [Gaiellaceae bacterium]|nr:GNAT family N-acetyltransferase [Gaiellaceae bacterium]